MKKQRLLVIGPVSTTPTEVNAMGKNLAFLEPDYSIDYIDSLSLMNDLPPKEYYALWQNKLLPLIPDYDAFFGFSFGGIILQQCFPLFRTYNKTIVLFSTPTFADQTLHDKLGSVITWCHEQQLDQALAALYGFVFYPEPAPQLNTKAINKSLALHRMIFGLTQVLATDSSTLVQESEIMHLHLIGARSNLVNKANVLAPKTGQLIAVPDANMRVLESNHDYCKKIILEALKHEH